MIINPSIVDELCKDNNGLHNNKVIIEKFNYENMNNLDITSKVYENGKEYKVYINIKNSEIDNVECQCEEYKTKYGACRHITATLLEFNDNAKYESNTIIETKSREKYIEFKELLNAFFDDKIDNKNAEELEKLDRNIKIVPRIIYDRNTNELKAEFKVGTDKQLYKIRDLSLFYDRMQKEEIYRYGSKLEFIHKREMFEQESINLLEFILKYSEIIKCINSTSNDSYRYFGKLVNVNEIILSNTAVDELFDIMKNNIVEIQKDYELSEISFIDSNPNVFFELKKVNDDEYKIVCSMDTYNTYSIIKGKKYTYFLTDTAMYRCSKEYENTILKTLEVFRKNFTKTIKFSKSGLSNFFAIIKPQLDENIKLDNMDLEEIKQYIPKKLGAKLYLDTDDNNYIIAVLKFCYEDIEINPVLDLKTNIARNVIEETKCLNMLRQSGFMLDKKRGRFVLTDEDKIYNLLSLDIEEYMKRFEVLITDKLKEKQIKQPKIGSLGVKIENNLLKIDIDNFNFDKSELKEILKKYSLKKKYHRLKDGTFISLENNKDLEFIGKLLDGTELEYKDIEKNKIILPMYRSLYLNRILEDMSDTPIIKDDTYCGVINKIENKSNKETTQTMPKITGNLRYYQKIGYNWLKGLENYKLGGILADDMGLGKTIQVIALLSSYNDGEEIEKKPSLVVCPSSLALNWKNEIGKFAPNLKTMVMSGYLNERKQAIENIENNDVIITSYDLLKRDIELYNEHNFEFKYVIADEAQYIKNGNTKNAKAIKQINAENRFALTGTPIENSLSELWSIFDFMMPGYLFSYKKFKENYEMLIVRDNDEDTMKKLKMLIEPFILRRTKKQVLTELPDKTITVLNNEMEEKQAKVYLSYLAQAKQELKEEIDIKGLEKSKVKILALLTRLRQICCHPSLFIENYDGGCSKLEQCIEIIKDAIASGHKILLFSGYTSMFDIIEKRLKEENINFLKLTGQTKVDERINLVDEFNSNSEIKLFLISLKAGGTGLNLTGADMVIHYDPWWNLSAENQATDRAYRIGQKNNVQVYKLITKNSIEEKIYELQEKKAKLIDSVLDTNTSFVSKLSKEEIMRLFE